MQKYIVQNLCRTQRGRRISFAYGEDEFARFLLKQSLKDPTDIATLRKRPEGRLLQRPAIRARLAQWGRSRLEPETFAHQPRYDDPWFNLSLGGWGSDDPDEQAYRQTSRTGHNLVLRLNFSSQHDQHFERIFGHRHRREFEASHHPIDRRRFTLAWSRVDLEGGDALIEEIQTDWLRFVEWDHQHLASMNPWELEKEEPEISSSAEGDLLRLRYYRERVLKPYDRIWREAMLSATLWYLVKRLKVRRVFYHSVESSVAYKGFSGKNHPPWSIYRDLPRRFTFAPTHERPDFLQWERRVEEASSRSHRSRRRSRQEQRRYLELIKSSTPMYVKTFKAS